MDTKKTDLAERRERAAFEGRKALAEYEQNSITVRKNMEKLKAARLEREAAEAAELLANPPKPVAKKKKAAAKKAT